MVLFPPPDSIGWGCGLYGGLCFLSFLLWCGRDVRVRRLHPFILSLGEARAIQGELAPQVVAEPPLDLSRVRYVAGADVSTQGDRGYAAIVVLSFPGLSVVEA